MMALRPRMDSATRRRDLRRRIRNGLGTSRDPAPEAVQAIYAVESLDELLRLATGGAYALGIVDTRSGEVSTTGAALREARG